MLQHVVKSAYRNLVRHPGFSAINIAGLTLGVTACMLIGLFVWHEYQYDKNIPGGERVYRVYVEYTSSEGTQTMAVAPPMMATALQQHFPEVEHTARVMMTAEYKMLFEAGKRSCTKTRASLSMLLFSKSSRFLLPMVRLRMHWMRQLRSYYPKHWPSAILERQTPWAGNC